MKIAVLFFVAICAVLSSLTISVEDAKAIGDRIWKNECGGTLEGLTHWGKGEEFGSFGIGHFIWYAEGTKGRFEETFPSLLQFLRKEKVTLPVLLQKNSFCPWSSREEFYVNITSPEMVCLREFLFATRGLQVTFMVDRFIRAIEKMPKTEKIFQVISRLTSTQKGLYALVDYVNFKGTGLSPEESYQGKKWGLYQVLSSLPSFEDPLTAFVARAKEVLSDRVKHAPPERGEERWLIGWHRRLDGYLE